ncbi:hypothetical protein NPIL_145951 [Nephila pilipes]|uniref:sn-1-specific diacylglycerol lipase ABHD11 n=1 Tax=Nephila pilipes TaxID=299642 RepID=A0A8X6TCN0_NEPPI|nr:hypothetical protein NPIL_145951 [Nephila pilipes]
MTSYTPVKLAFNTVEPDGCEKDKAPIIFLHGITASKEYWNEIPKNLANATKRKVYAIDSRNHGDSEWSEVFNFDCNVDDFLHFMDQIGVSKAILIGHSMGGITALKTALRAQSLTRLSDLQIQLKPTPDGRFEYKSNVTSLLETLKNSADLMLEPTGVYDKPTCFIYGELSPFRVKDAEEHIKTLFPNSKLVGIENAMHTVHNDCPQDFTEAVIKFILDQ